MAEADAATEGGSSGMVIVVPGAKATADVFGEKPGDEQLLMLMDPYSLALVLPRRPQDWVATARFFRELAHSATLMAERIDPDGLGQPTRAVGTVTRHE